MFTNVHQCLPYNTAACCFWRRQPPLIIPKSRWSKAEATSCCELQSLSLDLSLSHAVSSPHARDSFNFFPIFLTCNLWIIICHGILIPILDILNNTTQYDNRFWIITKYNVADFFLKWTYSTVVTAGNIWQILNKNSANIFWPADP